MSKEISPTDLSTILARLTWLEMQLGKFENATQKEVDKHRCDKFVKDRMASAERHRENIKKTASQDWWFRTSV